MATTKPDSSQIVFKPAVGSPTDVQTAVRALQASVGAAPLGGVAISNFVMNQATPAGYVSFTNTAPAGWNTGAGKMTTDFEFVSTAYFSANPDGHVAIVNRCDTDVIATDVRGAGAIMGNLFGDFYGGDDIKYKPTAVIESWSRPFITGQRFIWPETPTPRGKLLEDGKRYRWIIDTTKQPNVAGIYIRYRMYEYLTTKKAWRLLVDTGDVLDADNISDMTKSGLVFAHVFASNLTAWSISFENIKVTWGPAGPVCTDTSASLSRYGAELEGDLTFRSTGKRVRFPSFGGPSLADALTYQVDTTNAGTSIVIKPNGTSQAANHLYSNNSTSTTLWQGMTVGMSGLEAVLETLAVGTTQPDLGVNVGIGTRVATFKPTGIKVLNATKMIGVPIPSYNNMTNFGGTQAKLFNTTVTLDIDAICNPGFISSSVTTLSNVETMLRPLYCIVSELISELKEKKVI